MLFLNIFSLTLITFKGKICSRPKRGPQLGLEQRSAQCKIRQVNLHSHSIVKITFYNLPTKQMSLFQKSFNILAIRQSLIVG